MTPAAIVMMVVTILVVWGGLVASIAAWNASLKALRKQNQAQQEAGAQAGPTPTSHG